MVKLSKEYVTSNAVQEEQKIFMESRRVSNFNVFKADDTIYQLVFIS